MYDREQNTENKTPKIVQQIFGPREKEKLRSNTSESDERLLTSYPYHFLLYEEGEMHAPIIHLFSDGSAVPEWEAYPLFSEMLSSHTPATFEEALFLSIIFAFCPDNIIGNKINMYKPAVPTFIKEWLSPSKGLLLYAHQLEQLFCMIAGASATEALSFRKDWNLKRPAARQKASGMFIAKNYSLHDLLTDKTLDTNYFVYQANFRGAYQLMKYIQTIK